MNRSKTSYVNKYHHMIHMKFVVTFLVLFSIIMQNGIAGEQPQMPPAQVSVTLVKQRLLAPVKQISGSIISLNDTNLSTQVEGELLSLAEVGTAVQAGDIIARIVPTLSNIRLKTAKAQLAKLIADMKFREQEVKRHKALANKDNTSKARLQEEQSKLEMLSEDTKAAKAAVAMQQYYLSQTNIRAPFSGHVMERLASKGEYLSIGENVIRLVDTVNLEVQLNAPISLLPFLKKEQEVVVLVSGKTEKWPVKAIVPIGNNTSRMVEVRLAVPPGNWIAGTAVTISLPIAEARMRLAIPRDTLIIKGNEAFIYRIGKDMKSERIDASIDVIDGEWLAINANLKEGDNIVIRGGERLMPGQSVSLIEQ